MAKFRNVGTNPICLRGGRLIEPGEEFTPGTFTSPQHREWDAAGQRSVTKAAETGAEVDDVMIEFLYRVEAIALIDDEITVPEDSFEHTFEAPVEAHE